MNPSDIYSNTLTTLTAARTSMLTPGWQAALDQSTADQRLAASRELIQVQQAILALSNQSLSDIASSLQANQQALSTATAALQNSLKDITQVANIISSVSSLVQTVAKIVPLL
jgi:hypothetical protein